MMESALVLDVPYGADQTVFVVVDRLGGPGEIRIERTDVETIIRELFAGCYRDPARVLGFNTLEHWVRDISADVAAEIQSRCDIEGTDVPDHLSDFVDDHIRRTNVAAFGAGPHPHLAAR